MNDELMMQDLNDNELELVAGGHGSYGNITINTNVNVNITENTYDIVYAPVYVYDSTISNSNIDTGNTYVQSSHIFGKHHR